MTQSLMIFLIVFLLFACTNKQETKQWNLNQSIGWEGENPDDYTVLLIKWTQAVDSSGQISEKKAFDEAVLKELRSSQLGDQAENDDQSETDLYFVVPKDYKKALTAILSVAKSCNVEKNVTIYRREYESFDQWTDKVVHIE